MHNAFIKNCARYRSPIYIEGLHLSLPPLLSEDYNCSKRHSRTLLSIWHTDKASPTHGQDSTVAGNFSLDEKPRKRTPFLQLQNTQSHTTACLSHDRTSRQPRQLWVVTGRPASRTAFQTKPTPKGVFSYCGPRTVSTNPSNRNAATSTGRSFSIFDLFRSSILATWFYADAN